MINGELIVDNFAGGGGASTGIELATGKSVDIAINHDPEAIRMHKANHPNTRHYCEDVWQVDPVKACKGHPVGLAWFSPDCKDPIHTITTGNQQCLITPTLIQYHSETTKREVRGQTIEDPIMTVDGSNRYGLVTSFLSKFYKTGIGQDVREPLGTVTANAGGGHFGEVRAFLIKYYGNGSAEDITEPLDTITSRDRFGLVTIQGVDYQIVDIGLRMLEPRELYGCQGFPGDYIIDHDFEGHTYPRSEQVRRCGNSVCPPLPAAMVRSNLPELCVAERMPNITRDRIGLEKNGQLAFA